MAAMLSCVSKSACLRYPRSEFLPLEIDNEGTGFICRLWADDARTTFVDMPGCGWIAANLPGLLVGGVAGVLTAGAVAFGLSRKRR